MNIGELYNFDARLLALAEQAEKNCSEAFSEIEKTAEYNGAKVLKAFSDNRVSEPCFYGSTGYGYGDIGRETIDKVFAQVLGAEDALVRFNFVSGTHALSTALFGILRTGDKLVSITGKPYDTLEEVIGISGTKGNGSLMDYGVQYDQVDLKDDGTADTERITEAVKDAKVAYIQRSRGYSLRKAFTVPDIKQMIDAVKKGNPDAVIMVDNCYGEFVETIEPSQAGADMVVGSLIKNPGGGLAPIGGYIAGRKACVENAAYRLTSPGLGKEVGASLGVLPSLYQGLFLSPTVTASALKGAVFAANIYEKIGFLVVPDASQSRHDIIQAVTFGSPEGVIAFCEGIQAAASVDSFVTPEPWDMPGYDSKVIMAAGAFVSGSSIELSADGPIAPPYAVYFQGGLTFPHAKLGILMTLQRLLDKGVVTPDFKRRR